jgi:hypothetical protein
MGPAAVPTEPFAVAPALRHSSVEEAKTRFPPMAMPASCLKLPTCSSSALPHSNERATHSLLEQALPTLQVCAVPWPASGIWLRVSS